MEYMKLNMKNDKYWIWLQSAFGYENAKIQSVINQYKSAKDFYIDYTGNKKIDFLSEHDKNKLSKTNIEDSEKISELCMKINCKIITPEDELYPESYHNINTPPAVLYALGDLSKIKNKLCVGIVGTRENITRNGSFYTKNLAYRLAQSGAVVVSGSAKGIDTIALSAAAEAGGTIVSIIGAGLEYVKSHLAYEIYDYIMKNGIILSEFQPGFNSSEISFPIRNRLISGLSDCVVVTQSPFKSGSHITAGHAFKQSREVYTIPESLFDKNFEGNINLLKQGAIPLTGAMDILSGYVAKYPYLNMENAGVELINDKINNKELQKPLEVSDIKLKNLSETSKKIYASLTENEFVVDILIDNSEEPAHKILAAITEMELAGIIKSAGGKKYKIIL